MSFWYLATPYALYPLGRDVAFERAAEECALLTRECVPVYSPIVHNHVLCTVDNLLHEQHDLDFWLEIDWPFMEAACGVIVCCLESWERSRGIEREIEYFRGAGKPIVFMQPGHVPVELWEMESRRKSQ